MPRGKYVTLGGTYYENDWNNTTDEKEAERIIKRCVQFEPSLKNQKVEGIYCGLRPCRKQGTRVEIETFPDLIPVVHNYGHGGEWVVVLYLLFYHKII